MKNCAKCTKYLCFECHELQLFDCVNECMSEIYLKTWYKLKKIHDERKNQKLQKRAYRAHQLILKSDMPYVVNRMIFEFLHPKSKI